MLFRSSVLNGLSRIPMNGGKILCFIPSAFSLAGALIADKTPGFQAFSNPALLQFTRSNQVGVSFQNMSLDRSIKSFSFAKRLPPNAGVGLALLQSGTDNIQGKNSMNQDTELFSSSEIEGIISFGVGLGSKFALGINIKALFTTIYEEIGRAHV